MSIEITQLHNPTGIRIAKPTHNIKENSQFLYVDSDTPLFKVYKTGSGAIISNGTNSITYEGIQGTTTESPPGTFSSASVDITHDLTYSPAFLVFADRANASKRRYSTSRQTANPDDPVPLICLATGTSKLINLSFLNPDSGLTWLPAGYYSYYYYIFYNRIN